MHQQEDPVTAPPTYVPCPGMVHPGTVDAGRPTADGRVAGPRGIAGAVAA